jgi:drug/metabolite transporter (DMT)-like permease
MPLAAGQQGQQPPMHRQAYALLLLTTLFWGANAIAGKLAIGHVSPMLLTTFRWAMALAIMMVIGWRQLRYDWPVVRRHLPLLAALGAVGFTLFNATMYSALLYTSAINVSIEQAGLPMVIFLANFLLFSMRVSWAQMFGFLLTIVGIALTASHGDLTRLAEFDVNFGDALMMLALLFYGGYTVALRYRPPISWQSMILVLSASALLTSLPFAAWEIAAGAAVGPDLTGWAIVAFTAIFPSILSQSFYIRGVQLIGPNRAGIFINLVPIFGTLLAIVFLGEAFHLYHAIAIVLVLGGIWIAEHSGRKMAPG